MPCNFVMVCSRSIGIQACAALWTVSGGSQERVDVAVAVAMAESCLDPQATSPTCNVGLWQIGEGMAATYGYNLDNMYTQQLNAYVAVQGSSNGTNWAAWDVAYTAGEGLRRLQYLPDLQPGSSAANFLPQVRSVLGAGNSGVIPPLVGPPIGGTSPSPGAPSPPPDQVYPPSQPPITVPNPQFPTLPELHEGGDRIGDWENLNSFIGYDLTYFFNHLDELRRALIPVVPYPG